MRASLRIGWLCAVLVAAGCAVDSDGDDGPETGAPTSAAAEPAPATTAPSATTTPVVEPPTTAASPTEPETPEDPSLDEPSTTDPPTEDAPITSADKPSAEDDPADLQPQDDEAEPEPEATLTPEPVPETPLTWQGIPVVTVDEAVTTETEGAVRAPRLLSGFDDVEVLLHDRDRAWTFAPGGSVDKEWAFDKETGPVYPDGSGGIVYTAEFSPLLLAYGAESLMHWGSTAPEPTVLIDCSGDCRLRLIGVARLDDVAEVIYTRTYNQEFSDGMRFPQEILHRISLENPEPIGLIQVGGWEWWFHNTVIAKHELFGSWGTDGGSGLAGYDLRSGSVIHGNPASGGFSTELGTNCFDTQPSILCPDFIAPFDNAVATAFWTYMSYDRVFIVSVYDRDSGHHRYTLPMVAPAAMTGIHSVEIWDSVLVINTLTREGYPDHSVGGHPYRAVLVDLNTQETEFYSHPGILHPVPRSAGSPASG